MKKLKNWGDKMGKYGIIECPICSKKFIPAVEHAWKIDYEQLVCSYHCMRQWECSNGCKRRIETDYGAKLRKVK